MIFDFTKKYEVAVIGGGIAGVAAAVQAARMGKKVVLIEKTVLLGGLATTGLINVFLPICDGNGKQVSFGLCEELLKRSLRFGPGNVPARWSEEKDAPERRRYIAVFSPASYVLALDEILEESGVEVWFDTLVCDAVVKDCRVRGAIVQNESGRGLIEARQFIDASGSFILGRRAGIPFFKGDNALSMWALEFDSDREQTGDDNADAVSRLADSLFLYFGAVYGDGSPSCHAKDDELAAVGLTKEMLKQKRVYGVEGKDVSDYVNFTRRYLRGRYQLNYEKGTKDRQTFFPVKLPAMAQFRTIACIDGQYTLHAGENNRHFEDSIGLAADWRKAGPVWEIPYRTLVPKDCTGGILAAGRCTASQGDAWEITRVIPTAALTGQAAGMAAAIAVNKSLEPTELSPTLVQEELRKLAIPLHLDEVGLKIQR